MKIPIQAALALFFFGCAGGHHENAESSGLADSTSTPYISSSAAVEKNKDSTRKFIRSAELKFKVKNVQQTTYAIESIVRKQGGFVTYTHLTSEKDNQTLTQVSSDSSVETTWFTVRNEMKLRVPNTRLDTTLKEITAGLEYLDYRIIKAEDVALQMLSNTLTQKRAARTEKRLAGAIDQQGKKLKETTEAQELLLAKEEQSDQAKIANLSLDDQVNFSTIELHIYQRQTVHRELIPNDKNIDAYEPGLGSKMKESFFYGWDVVEDLLVFLVRMWGIVLFALIFYIVYRKYGRKS